MKIFMINELLNKNIIKIKTMLIIIFILMILLFTLILSTISRPDFWNIDMDVDKIIDNV